MSTPGRPDKRKPSVFDPRRGDPSPQPTPPPQQPGAKLQAAGEMMSLLGKLIFLAVALVIGVVIWQACSHVDIGSESSGPEPGSTAAQMCDVATSRKAAFRLDPTGKSLVEYDGIYYDSDCLDAYPWEAK